MQHGSSLLTSRPADCGGENDVVEDVMGGGTGAKS